VNRDYSLPNDPYGVAEYTAQSADGDVAIPAAPQIPLAALARRSILHLVDSNGAALYTAGSIAPTLFFEEFNGQQFIGASRWNPCYD
jgi:hypothetical protein